MSGHFDDEIEGMTTFPRPATYSFAIEHCATGRRDGNYFDKSVADEMLAWWEKEYPGEVFQLIAARSGDPLWPTGATDGRKPLRDFEVRGLLGAGK